MLGDEGKSVRNFFEELIKKNKGSFKVENDEEEVLGMG